MMAWELVLSDLLTNELRLFLGLFLGAWGMGFWPERRTLALAAAGGVLVTGLQAAGGSAVGPLAAELMILTGLAWDSLRVNLRRCLFLFFFYEVGVGLWDFLLQAALAILFRAEVFLDPKTLEGTAGIWLVRLLLGAAMVWAKTPPTGRDLRGQSPGWPSWACSGQ